MGFRDLVAFNHALLGKQAWRLIHEPLTLWGRLFKGLYFHTSEFMRAEKGVRPSWGWKSLLIGRDSISDNVQWSVGNGQQINIREDKWLSRGVIGGPAPRGEATKVADFILPTQAAWNESLLRQSFDPQLVSEILSLPIRPSYLSDLLIWKGQLNGKYTIKSAYNYIKNHTSSAISELPSSSYQPPRKLWSSIWHLQSPRKFAFSCGLYVKMPCLQKKICSTGISSLTPSVLCAQLNYPKQQNTFSFHVLPPSLFGLIHR